MNDLLPILLRQDFFGTLSQKYV